MSIFKKIVGGLIGLAALLIVVQCTQKDNVKNPLLSVKSDSLQNEGITDLKNSVSIRVHSDDERDSLVKLIFEYNDRGAALRDSAQYKEALNLHFRALQLAGEVKDTFGEIRALNNLGTDLRRTSSNIEATSYHFKALELANSNPEYIKSQAVAMNGLGNIYLELKNPQQARSYFEKSLSIEQQLNSKLGMAINYANIGETYKQEANWEEAQKYYEKSYGENLEINSVIGKSLCLRAFGEIKLEQKQNDEALDLMQQALNTVKDSPDTFHKLELELALCSTYIKLHQYQSAENLLPQIVKNATSIHSIDHLHRAYEMSAVLEKNLQNFQQALTYKELSLMYKDSINTQNNEVKILEIENKYKNKEVLQQLVLLTHEKDFMKRTKSNQLKIFILFFLLLLSVIAFLYYRYVKRKQLSIEYQKINEMKSRFFSNISHEFRTPLTLIKGPLEEIAQEKVPAKVSTHLDTMKQHTSKMLFLVDQILNLSKIDAGSFKIKALNADLYKEISGICTSFDYMSQKHRVDFLIELEKTNHVWYDPVIVEIIVTNLLSNAFKFTPEDGQVQVTGKMNKGTYAVCVANTGKTLSKVELAQIFDRYYSGDSHQTGSGIGLSLVKELCLLYRTEIKVTYNEQNALEFCINFPIGEAHFREHEKVGYYKAQTASVGQESDAIAFFETSEKQESNNQLPVVLIVEDHIDMRRYIASCFEESYTILEAKNGEEGINMAKEHLPSLIISDVMMPKIDGIQVCKILKTDALTNHIPIILLTALNEEEHVKEGLQNLADDYVVKPFSSVILRQKVENLIRLRETLSQKYRKEVVLKPLDILLQDTTDSFSSLIQEVIEKHITNPDFGVNEFCELAHVSRTQLHKKLKAVTNMSTTEFIRIHRLKIAAELLKNKNIHISEACFQSGFNDASYFSKQFKMVFGQTPQEYQSKFLDK